MAKTVRQRVDEAFADIDDDVVRHDRLLAYLQMLRDSANERTRSMRHAVTFALAAASLFLLLQTDLTPKLSLGPLEFLKDSVLSTFLSSAVAYLFLDAMLKVIELDRLGDAISAAFGNWNRKASQNDLDLLVMPDGPSYFSITSFRASAAHETTADRITGEVSTWLNLVVMLVPAAFQVYAFVSMVSTFGWGHAVVWINVVLATTLTALAYAVFVQVRWSSDAALAGGA